MSLKLDTHKAAELTGIPEQTLRKGRTKAAGNLQTPPFIKQDGRVLYEKEYLENWIRYVYVPGKRISR